MKTEKSTNKKIEAKMAELQQLQEQLKTRKPMPTTDEVAKYAEEDLKAAVAFINLILEDKPTLEKLVHELYQKYVGSETKVLAEIEQRIDNLQEEINSLKQSQD